MTEQEAIQLLDKSKNIYTTYESLPIEVKNEPVTLKAVTLCPECLGLAPEDSLTAQVISRACWNDEGIFNLIPSENLTERVYIHAIEAEPLLFRQIPTEHITRPILEKLLEEDWLPCGLDAQDFLAAFNETDLHLAAFKKWGATFEQNWSRTIDWTPEELITDTIADFVLSEHPGYFALLPSLFQTKERALEVVSKDGMLLESIPDTLRTREICDRAFRQDPRSVKHIPTGLIDPEKLIDPLRNNPALIYHIPVELRSERVQTAVAKTGNLVVAPIIHHPTAMVELIRNYNPVGANTFKNTGILSKFSLSGITEGFAFEFVRKVPKEYKDLIQLFPLFRKNRELAQQAILGDPENILHIPTHFLKDELIMHTARHFTSEFCNRFIEKDTIGDKVYFIPEEKRTRELCERIIEKAFSQYKNKYICFFHIPYPDLITEAIQKASPEDAVKIYDHIFQEVKTSEMFQAARKKAEEYVHMNPDALMKMPIDLRTPEVCLIATKKSPDSHYLMMYVPDSIKMNDNVFSFSFHLSPSEYKSLGAEEIQEKYNKQKKDTPKINPKQRNKRL